MSFQPTCFLHLFPCPLFTSPAWPLAGYARFLTCLETSVRLVRGTRTRLTSQTGFVPLQRIRFDLHQKQASCTRCAPSPSPVESLRRFLLVSHDSPQDKSTALLVHIFRVTLIVLFPLVRLFLLSSFFLLLLHPGTGTGTGRRTM